tara:strand:+ start:572 stop:709 length:138 start_codon:yes stop_codon:yes gene_type:complete
MNKEQNIKELFKQLPLEQLKEIEECLKNKRDDQTISEAYLEHLTK